MRVSVRPALAGLALLALLPLTACDETGGISVTTPEQAVQDAVIARESGDLAAAEGILRSALDDAPANVAVRSELAGTLMQRDGLDLLDIDRIAQFITSTAGTATGTPPATASATGSTCTYADDPTATPASRPSSPAAPPSTRSSRCSSPSSRPSSRASTSASASSTGSSSTTTLPPRPRSGPPA
jgi:hypothetical protein